jgi:hypothetical protein
MSQYGGDNQTHKATVSTAESTRQVAVAAAGSNQASVNSAEITFYRACVASAKTNSVSASVYMDALRALGTGGA